MHGSESIAGIILTDRERVSSLVVGRDETQRVDTPPQARTKEAVVAIAPPQISSASSVTRQYFRLRGIKGFGWTQTSPILPTGGARCSDLTGLGDEWHSGGEHGDAVRRAAGEGGAHPHVHGGRRVRTPGKCTGIPPFGIVGTPGKCTGIPPFGIVRTPGECTGIPPFGIVRTLGECTGIPPFGIVRTPGECTGIPPFGIVRTPGECTGIPPFGIVGTPGECTGIPPFGIVRTPGECTGIPPLGLTLKVVSDDHRVILI
jgi:hypothetical protein